MLLMRITRDINGKLLLLIIFFLILFIVFTVSYQSTVSRLVNSRENSVDDVTMMSILEKINKSNQGKESALIDKVVLEEKYNQVLEQKQELEEEKKSLQDEVVFLKSEIEYSQIRIDGPLANFRNIQDKNQQIQDMKNQIDLLCLILLILLLENLLVLPFHCILEIIKPGMEFVYLFQFRN